MYIAACVLKSAVLAFFLLFGLLWDTNVSTHTPVIVMDTVLGASMISSA